ncbi:amino acid ABC transporter substrate-binding protein [Permianibacter sp. IMCC34836]|uniref:substrate-binding periplasmic protein n=1 Tax=Permianibacter fluminis TaxID=2738515 RepID=UPI0015578440|nr:transporter substrate-binding domain-containing protein [Permianibacter fluminis]NQD35718.1 amino acid ABC transporter substrate-binding protein [Permianibacter fluminis]
MIARTLALRSLLPSLLLLLAACSGEAPPDKAPVGAEPAGDDAVAQAESTPAVTGDCQLVMGWDPYEPYQYADQDGTVRGLDVELVSEMAKQAGCSLSFVQKDWSGLISDLRAGTVSVLAGASKVAERESFALFSQPYRQEMFALYVRAGEQDKWQGDSLAELVGPAKKMRIGITDGYVYGPDIDQLLDDAALGKQFVSAPFSEAHAANLLDRKIDGMLEDPFVATAMIRRKSLSDDINRADLQIKTGDVSLMFSKASVAPDTVKAFDAALAAMRADGRYQQILKRYLP